MDIATIIGLFLGFGMLILGFILEGGHVGSLFLLSPAIIVFGGLSGALLVSFTMPQFLSIFPLFLQATKAPPSEGEERMNQIVKMAEVARREGLLALDEQVENAGLTPLTKRGIKMIVDGMDPELVRQILETELYVMDEQSKLNVSIFEAAGGYSPTMGIIGTVMGLVHVLGNLSNPDTLGPAIAAAFIATLYGVAFANLVFLPVAGKLKVQHKLARIIEEMTIEGVLSIQAGESPMIIREKLSTFLGEIKKAKKGAESAEE